MLRPKLLARVSTYEVVHVDVRLLLVRGFNANATTRRVEVEGLERAVEFEMALWHGGPGGKVKTRTL
jgi:hypothetical protein